MIPKIIHYCWLSEDPYPPLIAECIDSWKKHLPDYQIKRWSTKNFDIHRVPLVEQAYNSKKYAFAADFIRCYALYKEGGIYLDSDIMVYKNIEELFHNYEYISGIEFNPLSIKLYKEQINPNGTRKEDVEYVNGVGLQAAFMASIPGHPLLKACLEFYSNLDLDTILTNHLLAPTIQANMAEKFGFRYVNEKQILGNNILILPTSVIGQGKHEWKGRYLTHMGEGSWVKKTFKNRLIHITDSIGLYKKYLKLKDIFGFVKK